MALFRGHFRLIRPDPRTMAREAIGGGMMAMGAVLIPDGNDALLVYGLPSGSPHAIVSYIIILTLLALLLWSVGRVRRWLVWPMPYTGRAAARPALVRSMISVRLSWQWHQ